MRFSARSISGNIASTPLAVIAAAALLPGGIFTVISTCRSGNA